MKSQMANPKAKVFFRFLYGGLGLIALIAFSPIIIGLIGFFISWKFGCEMNEGGPSPCLILGIDFGEFLAVGSTGAFIIFLTLPAGFVAAGVYTGLLFILNRIFKFTN